MESQLRLREIRVRYELHGRTRDFLKIIKQAGFKIQATQDSYTIYSPQENSNPQLSLALEPAGEIYITPKQRILKVDRELSDKLYQIAKSLV